MRAMQNQTGTSLTHSAGSAAPRQKRRAALVWLIALATMWIDQITKLLALRALEPGREYPLVGELIGLRLVRNAGAAFSSLGGLTIVVTMLALVIVAALLRYVHTRSVTRLVACCLGFVAGGAFGNLVDRFVREPGFLRGHVVDFIDYFGWFVGNVADIAIVLAALVLVFASWRGEPSDG